MTKKILVLITQDRYKVFYHGWVQGSTGPVVWYDDPDAFLRMLGVKSWLSDDEADLYLVKTKGVSKSECEEFLKQFWAFGVRLSSQCSWNDKEAHILMDGFDVLRSDEDVFCINPLSEQADVVVKIPSERVNPHTNPDIETRHQESSELPGFGERRMTLAELMIKILEREENEYRA